MPIGKSLKSIAFTRKEQNPPDVPYAFPPVPSVRQLSEHLDKLVNRRYHSNFQNFLKIVKFKYFVFDTQCETEVKWIPNSLLRTNLALDLNLSSNLVLRRFYKVCSKQLGYDSGKALLVRAMG